MKVKQLVDCSFAVLFVQPINRTCANKIQIKDKVLREKKYDEITISYNFSVEYASPQN